MLDLSETSQYCPICQRVITAINIKEVECGEEEGYVFVHDDIEHSESDIVALASGIN